MAARIAQLEALLKAQTAGQTAAPTPAAPASTVQAAPAAAPAEPAPVVAQAASEAAPAKPAKIEPFSDWDWTWLNGNPRNKDTAFDSKFFTPEIRVDMTYTYDFNKPIDDSMGGSSELFRSNEIQLEQLGLGGDFHYDNVRARFMTQFGAYSMATIRNDPSPAKGQWNLDNADRYLAEAYGGYHINKMNGINIDAGIFMSYVGLFSYYNYDNWAYQPSYVSSNTPWFFQGIRLQFFPTAHLKLEPWIINGWQSYGSSNSRKGLGGQIKYTPRPWVNIISNNYGLGHDDLYTPNRGRIHTDNSVEFKYYDKPKAKLWDKSAISITADAGCEFGPSTTTAQNVYIQGVSCLGSTRDKNSVGGDHFKAGVNPKQSFIGYMVYDRNWFKHDKFALTIGGGQINNPGRYLVLVPPINGETAASAALNSPYFSFNPSDPFKAWDSSITFDWMPRQWLTFRTEYDFRHTSVPYWAGRGGMTPPNSFGYSPGTNNGSPQLFACNDGSSDPNIGDGALAAAGYCGNGSIANGGHGGLWKPDLRKDESLIDIDWMIKF
ncbi:MAG: outer membrane beta-barrel protein [Candidatus Korobacteraceae bacterium]